MADEAVAASPPLPVLHVARHHQEDRVRPRARAGHAVEELGVALRHLGQQVLPLAIDQHGAVKACKVVATQGDMTPRYGCDEAKTEQFEATGGTKTAAAEPRLGFMTVLVYGHEEHVA